MQLQGLPVSPEGLTSSRTAPHYSLMEILWLLTYPNIYLKTPCSIRFPVSLVFSHWHKDLSQILSLLTWEQESFCKGVTQPLPEVCQAFVPPALGWSTHWRDSARLVAALTPGTACVSAWQNSWVVIPFMSCCLCGTCALVYSLSHQHMRGKLLLAQAASTSACIMLCSAQPLLQGR